MNGPSKQQLESLADALKTEQSLPNKANAEQLQIAYSHVFRRSEDALAFAQNIILGAGESLVGGCTKDSIGDLCWLGVHIEDKQQWRAKGGYHKFALRDPEIPENEML